MLPPSKEIGPQWLQSKWPWLIPTFVATLGSALTMGNLMTTLVLMVVVGIWPMLLQFGIWKFVRKFARNSAQVIILALLVPCITAGWIIYQFSTFYGQPREFLKLTLIEKPPIYFNAEEFKADRRSSDVAMLKVHLNPRFLHQVLDAHFVKSDVTTLDGNIIFERRDFQQTKAGFCRVTVSPDFREALIEYQEHGALKAR